MELYVNVYSAMTSQQLQGGHGMIWKALVVVSAPLTSLPDDPSVGVDGPLHVSNAADRATVRARLERCRHCSESSPDTAPPQERRCSAYSGGFIARFVGVRVFKCPLDIW
jgi:hypothetical protein